MSFNIHWLFDRFRRRRPPLAVLAGGGEITYSAVSLMTEDEYREQSGGSAGEEPSAENEEGNRSSSEWEGQSQGDEPLSDEAGPSTPDEEQTADTGEGDEEYEEVEEEKSGGHGGGEWLSSLPPELHYLYELIRHRIGQVLHPHEPMVEPLMPPYKYWQLPIGKFIIEYNLANPPLTANDARLLLISLVTHVQPDLIEHSINSVLRGESEFLLIGGSRGKNFRGFIPTGQTAVFLLGGDDWKKDLRIQELFWADHVFAANKILWLGEVEQGEPVLSGRIILSQDYIDVLLHDKVISPHHSINFPAKLITTPKEKEQLVINKQLNEDFNHVLDWVKHKNEMEKIWQEGRKGYRCLFHGPSGTGKTFAACILGKEAKKEVYRIDLSMVVSKFIGETEKNLELIFARAEHKDWILFFDEADALFGKRTNIRDAHDKYANQEASYLLQRIEDYDGLVVLATNMKNNIDESFLRRFDSDLKFTMPSMNERKKIWQNSFPKDVHFGRKPKEKPAGGQETESGEEVILDTSQKASIIRQQEMPERIFYRYHQRKEQESGEELKAEIGKKVPEEPLDISDIVKGYSLSGANIQSVVHYATIRATTRQAETGAPFVIFLEDVENGIKRELNKSGIPLNNKNNKTRPWDNQQRD